MVLLLLDLGFFWVYKLVMCSLFDHNKKNVFTEFNKAPSTIMHIDINSAFATIEQQTNPRLRGRPMAVAAYNSPRGVILAPSIEAKRFGIKTGMRVFEGRALCPELCVLPPDPEKYRQVHLQLRDTLSAYTDNLRPKSIDEFVLDMRHIVPSMDIQKVAAEIKTKIREEVGEWISVSIGIGPSRFIAKVAAGMEKPDGLVEINYKNFRKQYRKLSLLDLHGINFRNELKLRQVGIHSTVQFYESPLWRLKAAFKSANAHSWYRRIRGWEVDNTEFARRSYGNSYALPRAYSEVRCLAPILAKLVNKTSSRLRAAGYSARGVHLSVDYEEGESWHKGRKTKGQLFDTREIYKRAFGLLLESPRKPVRRLAVSVFGLHKGNGLQLGIFSDEAKQQSVMRALDKINTRWGGYTAVTANMLKAKSMVPDRIAFGGVKELEELIPK